MKVVPLVLAGTGSLSYRMGRQKNVRWVGYVNGDEKRRLIAGCRAILFPSLWPEPLSTVAYEAYEMGKPVISSTAGGMKEIVFDRQTGRLLPPGDVAAWRETILQIAREPADAHFWGANGRRWIEKEVTREAWSRKFDEILQHVLDGQG